MNIRDISFCERQRSLIDEILHDGRSDRPDEVKRSLVRLGKKPFKQTFRSRSSANCAHDRVYIVLLERKIRRD